MRVKLYIYLCHLLHLLTSSTSVTTEASACATGVVTDTTSRTVLSGHRTITTVHLAAIRVEDVVRVVATVCKIRLCSRSSRRQRVGLFPTGCTEWGIVLQLVVRNGGHITFVIKRVMRRGAFHHRATGSTITLVALATVVHTRVP